MNADEREPREPEPESERTPESNEPARERADEDAERASIEPPGATEPSASSASEPEAGAASAPGEEPPPEQAPLPEPTKELPEERTPGPEPAPPRRRFSFFAEHPETPVLRSRRALAAQSRRDFLLFGAGIAGAAAAAWWLLPDRARSRLLPAGARENLDRIFARAGLSRDHRELALDRAIRFDDDIAEALYSKDRRVRTYSRSDVTPLRNNYNGETPGPGYLAGWMLRLSGLASGRIEHLTIGELLRRFPPRDQITRLVCVEGWSAIAWWSGIPFPDFLAAFPPAPGARWASLRSAVNLDGNGNPDPYYVSIDLATARHPQTLLATRYRGKPLGVEHGAPLRLVAPMKLGLKNIKAITSIEYAAAEPPDYWNERGYSKYDGL
jgi:DMSO/TMAO reductase YedYZ molybdopterin-dependent catalytic subunit